MVTPPTPQFTRPDGGVSRSRSRRSMPHEVSARATGGGGPERLIVSIGEQDFLGAVLDDLAPPTGAPHWPSAARPRRGADMSSNFAADAPPVPSGGAGGSVPQPGCPRLDPAKLDSMGLVLRRASPGLVGVDEGRCAAKGVAPRCRATRAGSRPGAPSTTAPAAARQIEALIAGRRG